MHKLRKNTALGYLTLLSVALLTTGRNIVFWLSQISFMQLLDIMSQLFAVFSCVLWLFGRIWDELLHKNKAGIYKYAAAFLGLMGFLFGVLNLAMHSTSLNIWEWAVNFAFTLFCLAWTLYTSFKATLHKLTNVFLWIMSVFSTLTLIMFVLGTAMEIYESFIQFPSNALFLVMLILVIDSLGLFAPVIYAVYEGISNLHAQLNKPVIPRR